MKKPFLTPKECDYPIKYWRNPPYAENDLIDYWNDIKELLIIILFAVFLLTILIIFNPQG